MTEEVSEHRLSDLVGHVPIPVTSGRLLVE